MDPKIKILILIFWHYIIFKHEETSRNSRTTTYIQELIFITEFKQLGPILLKFVTVQEIDGYKNEYHHEDINCFGYWSLHFQKEQSEQKSSGKGNNAPLC